MFIELLRKRRSIRKFTGRPLDIPKRLRAGTIIGIGHPDEHKDPVPDHLLDTEKIHRGRCRARPPR